MGWKKVPWWVRVPVSKSWPSVPRLRKSTPMVCRLRNTSLIGPSVWTGRALQAENDDLEKFSLALLYPAY